MKKLIIILFLLSFTAPSLAATVGGPEISIPEESLYLKREAVERALDRYESNMNIKGAFDAEIITKRELTSSDEVTNAEIEGQVYMFKFSNNFYNVLEPYVKIGTSNLEVEWNQNSNNVTVEAKPGFVWGIGAKAKICEFKDYGIKLTLDIQYTNFDLDVDKAKLNGSETEAAAVNELFKIKEWQASVLASKKFILPLGLRDYYVVPYAGITLSLLDTDVSFDSTSGVLYSTYNASDEEMLGIVLGCDVMPSLLSWYLINFELRLVTETAFSLGGTIKF